MNEIESKAANIVVLWKALYRATIQGSNTSLYISYSLWTSSCLEIFLFVMNSKYIIDQYLYALYTKYNLRNFKICQAWWEYSRTCVWFNRPSMSQGTVMIQVQNRLHEKDFTVATPEEFVHRFGGTRVINKVSGRFNRLEWFRARKQLSIWGAIITII